MLLRKHLEKDEKVVMVVHRHWLLGILYLFWPTVAFVSCWVVFYYAPHQTIFYLATFGSVGSIIWWIRNFLDYYLDAWIVTNQAVIDLEWLGLFRRRSARVLYSDIQGVAYEISGLGGTLLRYGTMSIEKISTGSAFELPHVFAPRTVESAILRSMEAYMTSKNLKNAKHVQEVLATVVAEQMLLNGLKPKEPPEKSPKKKGFATRSLK
jgi:hypothetical protein